MRKPLSTAERPIPVCIVSHTYSLAPHREVASLCRNGLIAAGWLRFVCANRLVIGETKMEIKERHGLRLDLDNISKRIRPALEAVVGDRSRMMKWQSQKVAIDAVADWANDDVSEEWGKKAAARVFHICDSGEDIEIDDPFAPGAANEQPIRYLAQVPAPERASTKYDVAQ